MKKINVYIPRRSSGRLVAAAANEKPRIGPHAYILDVTPATDNILLLATLNYHDKWYEEHCLVKG